MALSGSGNCHMSFAVSGATTLAASDARSISTTVSGDVVSGYVFVTGLTAGSNVFTAQYEKSSSITCTFTLRSLTVIPVS